MGKDGSQWFHNWIPRNAAAADLKAKRKPGSAHSGIVFKTSRHDDGSGRVSAVRPGRGEVGNLNFSKTGRIDDVFTSERRKGIATALYKRGQRATGGRLKHSTDRTAAGDAFAKAVGGIVPPRSAFRGR
ncbi:MAG TPA: hypothetical protein VHX15_15770 [Frankiaceae bacterium]|jgi:hypothetical protein|nr:hypothetical protein [Frankiaceae bacterium]